MPEVTEAIAQRYPPWIAVDLDGTLAYYDEWRGLDHVGEPIPLMLEKVREFLARGLEVRIFTARACNPEAVPAVTAWLMKHALFYRGEPLRVTNEKDYGLKQIYDDRAFRVQENTGIILNHV